ncbi:hypothetical protein D3C73_1642690 [compost metagenome]
MSELTLDKFEFVLGYRLVQLTLRIPNKISVSIPPLILAIDDCTHVLLVSDLCHVIRQC